MSAIWCHICAVNCPKSEQSEALGLVPAKEPWQIMAIILDILSNNSLIKIAKINNSNK